MSHWLKIQLLSDDAIGPAMMSFGAAGLDIYSAEAVIIEPGEVKKIRTDFALEIPEGYYCRIADRSSMALKKVITVGGIIDSDYTGPIFPLLLNLSSDPIVIEKGQRVAQLICQKVLPADQHFYGIVNKVTARGNKGFGSTG